MCPVSFLLIHGDTGNDSAKCDTRLSDNDGEMMLMSLSTQGYEIVLNDRQSRKSSGCSRE